MAIPNVNNSLHVKDWWDNSAEAGPKTRPSSEFGEPQPGLSALSTADQCLKPLVDVRFTTPH